MKLVLLAAGSGWHVRDLRRAAAVLDIELECVDFRSLAARLASDGDGRRGNLRGGELELDAADSVLVRTMPGGTLEQVVFRMDTLHWLESSGVPVVNPPRALEAAVDKYLSLARLEAAGLPVPATCACERAADALREFEALGGDVVSKPLFGSEGRGLVRVNSRLEAEGLFRDLEDAGRVIYQQRFIEHPGWDLRVLVIGGEVRGCMRRFATEGWITNVARGGRAEAIAPPDEAQALAVDAAAAVGAELAGVDLRPDPEGRYLLLEVNSVPGWKALSAVCGRDFAVEILEYVARKRKGAP